MSNTELEYTILQWISFFPDLQHPPETFASLSDGVALIEILQKIDPNIFNINKICTEVSGNWALCFSNLTYLYKGLQVYYTEVLHKPFNTNRVDIMKITKNDGDSDMYNLIELVIKAIASSTNKDIGINTKNELNQYLICQNAIFELMSNNRQKDSPSEDNFLESLLNEKVLIEMEELENENHILKDKVQELSQGRQFLMVRVDELEQECSRKDEQIKELLDERDKIQERMNADKSTQRLKSDLKLRDQKIQELETSYNEQIKKQKSEIKKLEEELDKQKRKVIELTNAQKELYKKQNEDCANMAKKIDEIEEELAKSREETSEANKAVQVLKTKLLVYKGKLEEEKNKYTFLDTELSKKKKEIESLREEKVSLETLNFDLEQILKSKNELIEKCRREIPEVSTSHTEADLAVLSQMSAQEFTIKLQNQRTNSNIYYQYYDDKKEEDDGLNQANELLKFKLEQAQQEIERLKTVEVENSKSIETLSNENHNLKKELSKLKKSLKVQTSSINNSLFEAEVMNSRRNLKLKLDFDDSSSLLTDLSNKTQKMKHMNIQIATVNSSTCKSRTIDDEVARKNLEIKDLSYKLETLRKFMNESVDQKDKELKGLFSTVQELTARNQELEKKITSMVSSPSKSKFSFTTITKELKLRK